MELGIAFHVHCLVEHRGEETGVRRSWDKPGLGCRRSVSLTLAPDNPSCELIDGVGDKSLCRSG